jgi:hypothetical protein
LEQVFGQAGESEGAMVRFIIEIYQKRFKACWINERHPQQPFPKIIVF